MNGIVSYGAYIPYHRLRRQEIASFYGGQGGRGEKAIASYDEDSISMSVEAASICLAPLQQHTLTQLLFATTSAPYVEKGSIPTIAQALHLSPTIQGLEVSASLRSGTSALMQAAAHTLVIASDCRTGAPNGSHEQQMGDAAAAFYIGQGEEVIASLLDGGSYQQNIVAQWQHRQDAFTQSWEERLSVTAFLEAVQQVVPALLAKHALIAESVSHVVIVGPTKKAHILAAKALGIPAAHVIEPLYDDLGVTGVAHAPLLLMHALEKAAPGDTILVLNYAEGLDYLLLQATEALRSYQQPKSIATQLAQKDNTLRYSTYIKWRDLLHMEPPRRPETERPSVPVMYRNTQQNIGFIGSQCRQCGTKHFPQQRICSSCRAKDDMVDYCFVGEAARVTTYTEDYLAASIASPLLAAVVDFDKGGRILCEITDCAAADIVIGMPVELTFRRLFVAGGISNYFWKVRPKRGGQTDGE